MGQTLIGAALNRKHDAYRVAKPRRVGGQLSNSCQASSPSTQHIKTF